MRYASVLAITLIFAASALAQQTPASSQTHARSANAQAQVAIQPPAHPITPAQVHEILELTGANHLAVQIMRGMMVNLRKSFPPYVPKDVIDDLEASMEKMDFESMAVVAYQKHISTEDAAQAITFYKTPAGRRIIGVMPQVVGEMQANGAKAGMQISQQVIARHMDEIKAAAEKYQQEHSAPPTVTSPN
ncbi:MAG: DUF2059 domain-containing protein [Silvibacterium sp.]